jgi:hypothetical protein
MIVVSRLPETESTSGNNRLVEAKQLLYAVIISAICPSHRSMRHMPPPGSNSFCTLNCTPFHDVQLTNYFAFNLVFFHFEPQSNREAYDTRQIMSRLRWPPFIEARETRQILSLLALATVY